MFSSQQSKPLNHEAIGNVINELTEFNGDLYDFVRFMEMFDRLVHYTDAPPNEKLGVLLRFLNQKFEFRNALLAFQCYDEALNRLKQYYHEKASEHLYDLNDIDQEVEDIDSILFKFEKLYELMDYLSVEESMKLDLFKIAATKFSYEKYVREYIKINEFDDFAKLGLLKYIRMKRNEEHNLCMKLELLDLKELEDEANAVYEEEEEEEDTKDILSSDLSPCKRRKMAHQQRLCLNCLKPNHKRSNCPSKCNCKKCGKRHHTLICSRHNSKDKNQPVYYYDLTVIERVIVK